ncbi:hypothetical protein EOE18_14755 [Novosphingobium umbonatum]|uniref:Uncharacterized protein n=1 Tax=Novosphingobium umbonatum TaxID=1908524 RepID=A0A3S3TL69_9SPHN|nr:hypothetical protein [Novosphingobium umbonatum]RVU03580.1 hypothetical protein EOE18_14755 [Novosphingobium umbonatum]
MIGNIRILGAEGFGGMALTAAVPRMEVSFAGPTLNVALRSPFECYPHGLREPSDSRRLFGSALREAARDVSREVEGRITRYLREMGHLL